jgi:hypothetical protein
MSYAESASLAAFQDRHDALTARADGLVEKAARLRTHALDEAYAAIETAARRVVAKADGQLSLDAAIDRVLKTAEGAALYSAYIREQERLAEAAELVAQARAGRELDAWLVERAVEKADRAAEVFGVEAGDAVLELELADPDTARAFGVAPVERVAKGGAWSEIERRADRLVSKSADGLTRERAVDLVLQESPSLYTAYVEEVGLA